mgnify:CR=1 FL=1
MRLLFVADPLEQFNIKKDSTFAMMKEAAARGHEILACEPRHLVWQRGGRVGATMRQVALSGDPVYWFTEQHVPETALADVDAVLMRKDPPFDSEYFYATHLLQQAEREGAHVFNKAAALRDHPEKLAILEFPQLIGPTLVTRDAEAIKRFHAEHRDIILKPLDGMGGMGIFRVGPDGLNLGSITETLNRQGTVTIMVQRFLPQIAQGDKRILVIGGEPVPYSLARIPQGSEIRGNLAAGGKGVAQPLSDRDRAIATALGPVLAARGLLLVGLDVIGDCLTEINVTSPTCFQEITQQTGFDVPAMFMDALEAALAPLQEALYRLHEHDLEEQRVPLGPRDTSAQAAMPTATGAVSRAPRRNSGWRTISRKGGSDRSPATSPYAWAGGGASAPALSKALTRRHGKSAQEFLRGQALAPRPVQFPDHQNAQPRGNRDAIMVRRQNLPRMNWLHPRAATDFRAPDFQRFPAQARLGTGKRVESAHAAFDLLGAFVPVNGGLALVDLVRVVHALGALRRGAQAARRHRPQGIDDQPRAQPRQRIVQRGRGVVRPDGQARLKQHIPGIEALVHLHDRDAGFHVTRFDGALDRRRTAPARQQRGVDVQAAQAGRHEHPARQDQAIGRDDQHVKPRGLQHRARGGGILGKLAILAQAARLHDGDTMLLRTALARARSLK